MTPAGTATARRIIVVYRADLPMMTRAKGEVQFGHAVAGLLHQTDAALFAAYMADGQPKISMEVGSLNDLLRIQAKAFRRGVTAFLVEDAAHTVFDQPTITCIGLGPMTKTDGNSITRGAKMRS
ncbi:aminoacyl-tRNA hydrolase [Sphingomonas sp. Leaf33]|uniref:aminoacyl-tRNA hydrolase n=1 Tax=Sphingomonas sp. Leaf33 TaxID=1736215 RepID=UPI00138F6875|nr:aminoacyl-tRNA hydrolase [Sphingomonas sp. Leaf33]